MMVHGNIPDIAIMRGRHDAREAAGERESCMIMPIAAWAAIQITRTQTIAG